MPPTTTVAPAPPVSGFYIVGEDVYSTGVLIYGFDLGLPLYYVLGIAYNLPEGAEIRSPRDGFMSFANFVLEQSGTLHTAGAVDLSTFFPDGNPLAASSEYGFDVAGNGLEFLIAQAGEESADRRMIDGAARGVGLQVALGDIGIVLGAIDKNVIPRPVLGRPAPGHGFIPFGGALEFGVDVDDHAPVIEKLMLHQGAGGEFRVG